MRDPDNKKDFMESQNTNKIPSQSVSNRKEADGKKFLKKFQKRPRRPPTRGHPGLKSSSTEPQPRGQNPGENPQAEEQS